MKRRLSLLLLSLVMVALPGRLVAQTGCEDSPESPTLVLALVGAAGMLATRLRGPGRR